MGPDLLCSSRSLSGSSSSSKQGKLELKRGTKSLEGKKEEEERESVCAFALLKERGREKEREGER